MIQNAGGEAIFFQVDVADEVDVVAMVEQGLSHYGRLDILCNNAGIGPPTDNIATELPLEVFQHVMRVNVQGAFICSKYAIPHIIESGGGSVINIASIAGLKGAMTAPVTAYGTSKAAVIGLSKQLAAQFAPHKVRVNVICPGPTDTPILEPFIAANPELRGRYVERTPLQRMGRPDDIANLCLYLASDESVYMTGSVIVIDGGITTV
jgi:NAD(P)-dependent dehydrogenase (short-subunit alcohol dehydrogenase family)